MPVATQIPGPKFVLTSKGASDAGGLFNLGNTDPDNAQVAAFAIDFYMSLDWQGSIGITSRLGLHRTGADDAPMFGNWPFRAFYLNGVGVDGSMVSGANAVITGSSSILVPASGRTIGLGVSCTQGSCTLYFVPVLGPSVP